MLQVYQVGFGEDATSGGDARRTAFSLQGESREVLQADAQTICLLLQEPAGACGAEGIRGYFPRFLEPVLELDDEGTLPADLDNCLRIGMGTEETGDDRQRTAVFGPVQLLGDNALAGTGHTGRDDLVEIDLFGKSGEERYHCRPGARGYPLNI